jgi:hypothetical protein
MPFHLRLPSCLIGGLLSVLGGSLGRNLVVGRDLRLRLEGESVRCKGLLIGVWRWMRGCPISMLLGGLGYRDIHPGNLLIRFGSEISPYSKRMKGRNREG